MNGQAVLGISPSQSEHEAEREGGRCPMCGRPAKLIECWECCESSWVIDCGHLPGPRPMRWGRADGSARDRPFCDECGAECRDA
jgi:hypothetical protein